MSKREISLIPSPCLLREISLNPRPCLLKINNSAFGCFGSRDAFSLAARCYSVRSTLSFRPKHSPPDSSLDAILEHHQARRIRRPYYYQVRPRKEDLADQQKLCLVRLFCEPSTTIPRGPSLGQEQRFIGSRLLGYNRAP
jgi:hypothetical protein